MGTTISNNYAKTNTYDWIIAFNNLGLLVHHMVTILDVKVVMENTKNSIHSNPVLYLLTANTDTEVH